MIKPTALAVGFFLVKNVWILQARFELFEDHKHKYKIDWSWIVKGDNLDIILTRSKPCYKNNKPNCQSTGLKSLLLIWIYFMKIKGETKRRKIIIYYVIAIVIPSIILGILAYRGVKNDQALVEREQRRAFKESGQKINDNVDAYLKGINSNCI